MVGDGYQPCHPRSKIGIERELAELFGEKARKALQLIWDITTFPMVVSV